ncbi:MAG TPA: GNAT family N-acetyltransferase [Jatrophihabitans sp.]|nr:GNAT family N-acetyltransferase [Jatrophihabitans sp.]
MLHPDYPIVTERLLLRPLDPATDVEAVYAYQSRPDVCRHIPYQPRTREQVTERLADPERTSSTIENEGDVISLAVVVRETGELVGDVILFYRSAEHRAGEIGYVLNPNFHGNGYATEASRALLGLAFGGLGLHRVIARIDARNDASAAVLRRLGMRQEAVLIENEWFKGEWTTEIDFAILAHEWNAARVPGSR